MPASFRVPLGLPLKTPSGAPTTAGEVLSHPLTVVHLVRYFGCLPCQEWLVDLDRVAAELSSKQVGAIAVGGSADYQAEWLHDEKGVRMPLLLDPDHGLRDAIGADKPLGWRMADPRGAVAYARSLKHGYHPQSITRDTVRSPGVAILDDTGLVRWKFVGNRIGHYPPLGEVLKAVEALAS